MDTSRSNLKLVVLQIKDFPKLTFKKEFLGQTVWIAWTGQM